MMNLYVVCIMEELSRHIEGHMRAAGCSKLVGGNINVITSSDKDVHRSILCAHGDNMSALNGVHFIQQKTAC